MFNKFEVLAIRFKACPKCGHKLFKTKDGYLVCSNCDYEEYDG